MIFELSKLIKYRILLPKFPRSFIIEEVLHLFVALILLTSLIGCDGRIEISQFIIPSDDNIDLSIGNFETPMTSFESTSITARCSSPLSCKKPVFRDAPRHIR